MLFITSATANAIHVHDRRGDNEKIEQRDSINLDDNNNSVDISEFAINTNTENNELDSTDDEQQASDRSTTITVDNNSSNSTTITTARKKV